MSLRAVSWSAAALALGIALAGCDVKSAASPVASLTYTEDAHAAYREAMESYESKDWEDARALFAEVKQRFGATHYARLAELRMADADFEQAKYNEAIAEYRAFLKAHRGDPNVEYCRYRISKALFLDISDSLFLPPQEERDQADARDAHRELRTFMREYPRSAYLADARYMLEVVTQRLVRHELYVARYYLREDNFDAVVARIDYALDKFPGSGLDAEALVLKGETLLKMHKPVDARAIFDRVIRDHGGPFGGVARRFLAVMDGQAPPSSEAPAPPPSPPAARD